MSKLRCKRHPDDTRKITYRSVWTWRTYSRHRHDIYGEIEWVTDHVPGCGWFRISDSFMTFSYFGHLPSFLYRSRSGFLYFLYNLRGLGLRYFGKLLGKLFRISVTSPDWFVDGDDETWITSVGLQTFRFSTVRFLITGHRRWRFHRQSTLKVDKNGTTFFRVWSGAWGFPGHSCSSGNYLMLESFGVDFDKEFSSQDSWVIL